MVYQLDLQWPLCQLSQSKPSVFWIIFKEFLHYYFSFITLSVIVILVSKMRKLLLSFLEGDKSLCRPRSQHTDKNNLPVESWKPQSNMCPGATWHFSRKVEADFCKAALSSDFQLVTVIQSVSMGLKATTLVCTDVILHSHCSNCTHTHTDVNTKLQCLHGMDLISRQRYIHRCTCYSNIYIYMSAVCFCKWMHTES